MLSQGIMDMAQSETSFLSRSSNASFSLGGPLRLFVDVYGLRGLIVLGLFYSLLVNGL